MGHSKEETLGLFSSKRCWIKGVARSNLRFNNCRLAAIWRAAGRERSVAAGKVGELQGVDGGGLTVGGLVGWGDAAWKGSTRRKLRRKKAIHEGILLRSDVRRRLKMRCWIWQARGLC